MCSGALWERFHWARWWSSFLDTILVTGVTKWAARYRDARSGTLSEVPGRAESVPTEGGPTQHLAVEAAAHNSIAPYSKQRSSGGTKMEEEG